MENKDILSKTHIHFIGICGISMSALALLLNSFKIKITGSDAKYDSIINILNKNNIDVYIGHKPENISNNCELVVYTGAVSMDNVEIKYAINNNIPIIERSELLGCICNLYNNIIAIAGTHGKTTTTAIIAEIFEMANLNPTVHLGGISDAYNSNLKIGSTNYFITEACEYKNSFRYINSNTCIITSTDPDHLDSYNSVAELKKAYNNFAKNSKNVILGSVVKDVNKKGNVVKVGYTDKCNLIAKNIKCNKSGNYSFDAWYNGKYLTNFKINAIGKFNVDNAICAIAVALEYGISVSVIYDALSGFKGVKRRNEKISTINNVPVICDYAHHPTEILSTISAYKQVYKNILCIFQPHTYTRTKTFMNNFKTCFKGVNKLIIYKTYPAREKKIDGGDATDLYKNVKISPNNKYYVNNKFELKKLTFNLCKNIDCVLVLGAGNIYNIAKNVFKS